MHIRACLEWRMTRLPQLLFGRDAYSPVQKILEGLPFEKVGERPAGLPHSIYEELWHLNACQKLALQEARGEQTPPFDESLVWPANRKPRDEHEWEDLLHTFFLGLDEAAGMAAQVEVLDQQLPDGTSVRGVLEDLLAHNSYHLGRLVVLRQLLGLWEGRQLRSE